MFLTTRLSKALPSLSKMMPKTGVSWQSRLWTPEEEQKLREAVAMYPEDSRRSRWRRISAHVGRPLISCYHKWTRNLDPKLSCGRWTLEENVLFSELIQLHGYGNWAAISNAMGRMRNPDQIRQKAMQSLKSGNGRWKPDEDQRLQEAIEQFQSSNLTHANGFMWRTIAKQVKTRDHLECRMRYMSLADNWKMRARWTGDEVATLLRCQKLLGSRWMDIARHLPGRTPRSCAAKFHSLRYYNEIDHDPS